MSAPPAPDRVDFRDTVFEGRLGQDAISIILSVQDGEAWGRYRIRNDGYSILLRGTVAISGQADLLEGNLNEEQGHFEGRLSADRTVFKGTWHDMENRNSCPFSARQVVASEEMSDAVHRLPEYVSASVTFPSFKKKKLYGYVKADACKEFESNCNEMRWLEPPENKDTSYYADTNLYDLAWTSSKLISFAYNAHFFAGGSGYGHLRGVNIVFDRAGNPRELRLAELFLPSASFRKTLADLCTQALVKTPESEYEAQYKPVTEDDIEMFEVSPWGIKVLLSMYDHWEVQIPFESLGPILNQVRLRDLGVLKSHMYEKK